MKTLADVPVERVWQGQQAALMRLQLYLIGKTHEILGEFAKAARAVLLGSANDDGTLDGLGMYRAQNGLDLEWKKAFGEWKIMFEALRREAGSIPFGTLAVLHESMMQDVSEILERAEIGDGGLGIREFEEAGEGPAGVFEPQLQSLLGVANRHVYKDGVNLSGRIWNLDQESLAGIQRELYTGVANGDSAWNIAQRVEQYLGAGKDCPRWTSTRLYQLTKKDIASGDRTGLYSGDECAGQGVAYNALRMARNEIQIMHHLATDEVMGHSPWVEQEQIHLSPAHPKEDMCDDAANGGEKGDGVYPVGDITLPLHVQCLCWKSAVQMNQEEFVTRLRDWMTGAGAWAGMDDYATWIRADRLSMAEVNLAVGLAQAFVVWLWGDEAALDAAVQRDVQMGMGL